MLKQVLNYCNLVSLGSGFYGTLKLWKTITWWSAKLVLTVVILYFCPNLKHIPKVIRMEGSKWIFLHNFYGILRLPVQVSTKCFFRNWSTRKHNARILLLQCRSMPWKTRGGGGRWRRHKVISRHVITKTYLI